MVMIVVRDLAKRFGTATVLNQIDLTIGHGELFFLLGPSGCGKTTLLRHIAGFYQPDHGAILFDRDNVTGVPAHRRGTGMMFQSYALWPHLTVAQNVAFGLEEQKRPRQEILVRVEEALDAVQLGGLGDRRIQQLSGGQQQRVALARALVVRPRCLLLDEPLSNLDARLRLEMRAEIRRICKAFGLTAIYVTHDQEEALSMADRLAVMDKGQLVQIGSPIEVYRDPVNRMVAEFIGETNFIPGRILGQHAESGAFEVETPAGALLARCRTGAPRPATGQRVSLSVRPEALRVTAASDVGPNRFIGRILDTTYLGSTVQYRLQIASGLNLKLTQMNPLQILPVSGATVVAQAAPEDLVLLPE